MPLFLILIAILLSLPQKIRTELAFAENHVKSRS